MNFENEHIMEKFPKMYGENIQILEKQEERYRKLEEDFLRRFDECEKYFFSSPGRTEIGGNHTDHNNGKVIAASINLDSIAVVTKNQNKKIILYSEGYSQPFEVNLNNLKINEKEKGTTTALIRGIANRLIELGFEIGGFAGCMTSDVLRGSGLSSSASVEMLIGTIFNFLFNEGKVSAEAIAQIGQYAENIYFGKPCGLMDQMACSVGGIISIDFKNPVKPVVEKVDVNFNKLGYSLVIVDTGGNHADLTDDYAAVPAEMKSVAKFFGKPVLRNVDENKFLENITEVRKHTGDRAVMRAMHFFEENKRVSQMAEALNNLDVKRFLQLVKESGDSSFKWLQNIFSVKNNQEQGVSLALALTEKYLSKIGNGACRVHGGGFAGTIQVFIQTEFVMEYIQFIERVFGIGSAMNLTIRSEGAVLISDKVN
jgi:galactokinase